MYLHKFTTKYPYLVKAMQETEHTSPYHMEGSVWTHTCMVYTYVKAKHPDNKVLLLAALLHDVGKPSSLVVKPTGKHSFNGHEGVSTFHAITLAKELEPTLTQQQLIDLLNVISLHGTNVSQASIPYLYLFRLADITGRISDQGRDDYDPRKFYKPTSSPTHHVTILCGLPCSGKSTFAKQFPLVLSRDNLLTDMYPDLTYNDAYDKVHSDPDLLASFNNSFNAHINSLAKLQKDLVVDMTMLSLSSRRKMMSRFPKASFSCIVFLPPLETIQSRNYSRPNKFIEPTIIQSMMKSFVMPIKAEGFTTITYKGLL